jgi:hypothetical protein
MEGLTANAAAVEHEEYMLRMEDRKAVMTAAEEEAEARRRSLNERIQKSREQKELDMKKHRAMLDAMHNDFALKTADWNDMKEYKQKEKERSRKSIAMRLNSWRSQKLKAEEDKLKEMMRREEEYALAQDDFENSRYIQSINKYSSRL